MEIVVKVIHVLPEQSGTSKTGNQWRLKTFIGETQERYPKKICFELFGDNLINNNPVDFDDTVTVSFDIESQEYNGRWYTKIRAWKIVQGDATQAPSPTPTAPSPAAPSHQQEPTQQSYNNPQTAEQSLGIEENEDLPF